MCRSFNRTAIVLAVLSLGFGADAIFWLGGPPGTGSQVLALNLDDPCKDVECPECYVCVDGTCVYNCDDETDATSGDPCPDAPPWPEVPTSGLTAPAGDIPPLPPPELPPCPDPDQPPDVQLCAASVGSSGSTHGCGGGGVSAGGGGAPCQEDSEQDPAPPSYNQDPPAQTGGGGSGKGSIGDGVYLNLSKGQVGASVHVLETYAYGSTELSLTLYYDSRSAYVNTVFGAYGWSHSFFGRVEEKLVEGTVVKVTFWYGRFQRIYFLWNGQTFVTANGRRDILTRVGSHYEITMEDGVHLVFDDEGRLTERTDVHDLVTRYYYSNGRLVKVVTPHGREIQFEYDTNGRLETIIGPDARETTLTYDPSNGNLIRVTDPTMHSTSYEYDSWHRMTKETLKDNRYYTIEYSSYLDKRTIKDSEGNVVASVSSAAGFPSRRDESALSAISPGNVTVVDGRGATWTLYRDDKGRITSIVSPNNYTRSVTYGGDNDGYQSDRIVSVTNERNLTEQYTYTAYGRLATERNRANQLWSYSYHPSKPSLLTIITEPDTDQWVYAYDSHGRVTQITDPLIETPTDAVTTITYEYYGSTEGVPSGNDPLPNRIKKYTQTDVNGHVMVCECDYQGNITKMTRGYGTGLLNLVTRCEYDPLGRRTRRIIERGDRETIVQWVRDEVGRVTTSIDDPGTGALNLTTSYVYDGEGHLKEVTNPRGHKTKFDYDHRGRAVKRTVAYGSLNLETHWTYDGNGNVETITDANNNTTTFTYNAQNFLISVLDPENYQTIFTRDGVGNATRIDRTLTTNPNGDKYSVSQTFDNINRRLTQTVAPETLALTTQFDYTDGGCACRWRPHKITSPDNKITYLYYDKLDRLVKLVRKVTDTADNGGDTDDIIYQRELDPVGNVTAVVLPEGERTEYEYDEANRLVEETRIGPSSTTIVTTATYDGADNLRVVTLPNNNQVTRTYDAVNRLDTVYDSVGAILDLGYDANSNITSRADGLNHTWQYQYDQADRPVKLYDPLVEGGTDKYTSLTYDGLGNRLTATDNNGIITGFEYDKLSRLTKTVEHKNGTGDTANTQTVYTYDGMGRVKTMADHNGNTTTYLYDDAGRLTDITFPDPSPNTLHYTYGVDNKSPKPITRTDQKGVVTTFEWDNMYRLLHRFYPGHQDDFTYNRSGRLLTANNSLVNETFGYDILGRVTSLTQAYGTTETYATTVGYAIGSPDSTATVTYPGTREVVYTFDRRFRMTGVSGGTGVGGTRGLDVADQVVSSSFANGVSSVFDYDVNGRMTHMERFKNGAPPTMLVEYDYGYDAVGNRLYTRDMLATDRSELYGYDARNRLRNFGRGTLNAEGTAITTPLVDPVLPSQQQWTDLDRRGNWLDFSTTLNGQPAVQQTRTVNGVNEVLTLDPDGSGAQSAMTLANDPNGNLTENPWTFNADDSGTPTGQKYEYDEENRLVRVRRLTNNETLLEISYDALGRRVESKEYLDAQVGMLPTARVTRHVVLGAMTIEEHVFTEGSGWALAREFVWGTEYPMPVAIIDYTAAGQVGAGQPEVLHYLRDVLGNVVALANADGNVVERYRYDPYGMTHIYNAGGMPLPTSAYGNPFAFTGQRYDAAVVLYHFWFRTYSPTLGRWHQRDLLGYFDGLSLYQYVLSSPAMRVDPFGLWSIFRWLYTGDPNAPDYVYRAAVDAAASWLWRNSPVRGGFVEAEYETRYGQIVGEASWSMDSGFGGFGGFQVGNSQRRRGWTGAVPFSRLPGPLYQSDTLGLEGGLCWSEEDGLTVCTEVSRSIGMSGSTYAGSVFLGWDPSSNWIEIGISRGPISAGLSIDPSKIDDYVESVFGDGDDSGDDFGSCPAE